MQNLVQKNLPNVNNISSILSTLKNHLYKLSNNPQLLAELPIKQTHQIQRAVLQLIESLNKNHAQENTAHYISQQLTLLAKPLSSISGTTANTPANQAIMQLLGIAFHGQQFDQNSLQNKAQLQLKQLLEQINAKLQINQLRHLGIDATRETPSPFIQQSQGELALRFNEQILPLSYNIQGFAENYSEQENKEGDSDTKEKTRRWQVFMSLDLPHNETLHCKITLVDHHIKTTFWAESTQLCKTTLAAMKELRDRFTQAGLSVDNLQCFEGKPPQDETSVSYNLVDITT